MEFNQLRYFTTLVEEGAYTKAAKRLHIAQPSLSAAVKKLENAVGFSLLNRTTRHLRLTKEGDILYQEATRLVHHFDHVKQEMIRLKKEGPSELTIGIIESSMFWTPTILKQFKEKYKNVRIQLTEILSLQDVVAALKNYNIHLAITNQYMNSNEMNAFPIYEEQLVVLLPPDHPLQYEETLQMDALKDEELIICKEGLQSRTDILTAYCKAGIKPNIQYEVERFETACNMVEENLGITILPENYVKQYKNATYHIKEIYDADLRRTVYVAVMKDRYLPPLVKHFIALIRNYFGAVY
ncbi:MAG TPA: LysR family transcriptional regulator [Virgibacillus sp.]|nr:LysR family transcriptional regulator [Virgibacillus sp.]HLR67455.1 LysR family transcriptional regulator [Virgibacillus sp.]